MDIVNWGHLLNAGLGYVIVEARFGHVSSIWDHIFQVIRAQCPSSVMLCAALATRCEIPIPGNRALRIFAEIPEPT